MKTITLTSRRGGAALFAGAFPSFKSCLAEAVKTGADLRGIDLSHRNLTNIALDDAHMPEADLRGANLTGANLSDADLRQADLRGASLYNACFAGTDLRRARFEDAFFGGTIIQGARLGAARFSTLSSLLLDFDEAEDMEGAVFIHGDGLESPMSAPPVVIRGLHAQIVIFDRHIKLGHMVLPVPIL